MILDKNILNSTKVLTTGVSLSKAGPVQHKFKTREVLS